MLFLIHWILSRDMDWGNKRSQRDAMQLVPFMEEFNQERLQVTDLEEGMYRLTIGDLFIDNLSSKELAVG